MEPFFPSAIILLATTWLTLMTCFTLALNILHRGSHQTKTKLEPGTNLQIKVLRDN